MSEAPSSNAGAQWVERFLLPLLDRQRPGWRRESLRCLQLDPDDEDEAIRLRSEGITCDILLSESARATELQWETPPTVAPLSSLGGENGRYDLVLTGRLGAATTSAGSRKAAIKELGRVTRPGAGVLVCTGNRRCPLDLTRNASLLHGRDTPALMDLAEATHAFLNSGAFHIVEPVCVAGHLGWSRLPSPLRPLSGLVEGYWRYVATPERRWLYASALNPILMIWAERS